MAAIQSNSAKTALSHAWTLLFCGITALGSMGCVSNAIAPVESNTKLGRVIVYRNGVAYFERFAAPGQKELTLRVPAQRVDDFLKSLTITDEKSGEPLPISYPTITDHAGMVDMTIKLPRPSAKTAGSPSSSGRLRITYVTESPSWKPTYRIILGPEDDATLHGWAVVDNVSGEDWTKVRVGVGSTSALSFRYDLHSVRLVERQTLTTGETLALAPPTGGSPYAVAGKKVRVLGNFSSGDLSSLRPGGATVSEVQALSKAPPPAPAADGGGAGWFGDDDDDDDEDADGSGSNSNLKHSKHKPQDRRARRGHGYVKQLSQRVSQGQHRVRVEGFAQRGDADAKKSSLARANALRDKLIANGVPAHQIDVVGTGLYNARDAARIVAVDATLEKRGAGGKGRDEGERAGEAPVSDGQPLGQAHFVSDEALTIAADHSAMVSMLNQATKAQRVYFFDPVSDRGSKRFAFNAVRLVNPSKYTLDSGPFTVYAGGQFLGEGLSEAILPHSTAFIPYALDRSIVTDAEIVTREEIDRLLTIQRGIVTTETQRIRRTKLSLANRGKQDAKVYVRHAVASGYKLKKSKDVKVEKLNGAHLFPVVVKAGEELDLIIEETTPILKTVDIRTKQGVSDIQLYLKKRNVDPELAEKLRAIVKRHTETGDLHERIGTLDSQMAVYRKRSDELNVQLFTLKKVPQAAKLRKHLANKMEEISDKLQKATMEMTDLKGRMMTQRIELQDALAELTLKKDKPKAEKKVAKADKPKS